MKKFLRKLHYTIRPDARLAVRAGAIGISGSAIYFYLIGQRPATVGSAILAIALVFVACILYEIVVGITIDITTSRYLPWLINGSANHLFFRDIQTIEGMCTSGDRVYVITQNLHLDVFDQETIDTVEENLKEGVRYAFIVPQDADIDDRLVRLTEKHSNYVAAIEVYRLAENWMRLVAFDNLMLIVSGATRTAFIRIPEKSGKWWAEMTETSAQHFHGIIKLLDERASAQKDDPSASVRKSKLSSYLI